MVLKKLNTEVLTFGTLMNVLELLSLEYHKTLKEAGAADCEDVSAAFEQIAHGAVTASEK